ncbi:MAG: aminomethyltransferase family protein [Pyrinomonadaceae bacterium MAG19_C2-C3]|nr:aminomethyltransferase family protein [Pyrinomonadaceae bacterium MAG19_C2-C3]
MTTITDTPSPDTTTDTTAPNRLPLHLAHERHGAIMHARGGWIVPAHYGDTLAEYKAVRDEHAAALFDLSSRARLEVSGAEAVQFLNGMITNDIATLETGAWMFAAFPNVQGRLIAMARVLCTAPNTFLFDLEAPTHETILKNLTRFTFAGDFHLTDRTHDTVCLSVQGAHANGAVDHVLGVEAASLEPYRGGRFTFQDLTFTIMRATHTGEDGFDIFIDAASASVLFDRLIDAGVHPAGYDALEILRIEAGIPRHGTDINDSNIVLEAGNTEAVSFTKGCYIGQEIIARIHWRGHVAKQLAGIQLASAVPLEPDTKLYSAIDDKEAGRITSVAISPALGRTVALAIVKYAYLAPDTQLVIKHDNGTMIPARVVKLPHLS